MNHSFYLFVFLMGLMFNNLRGDDYFDINHIKFNKNQPAEGTFVFKEVDQVDKDNKPIKAHIFEPFLEVRISVKNQIKSSSVLGKAYFYDENKKLIATTAKPDVSSLGYDWPVILSSDKDQFVYFAVPDLVLKQSEWSVLIVFGDLKGIDAQLYSLGSDEISDYDYPEKKILEDKNGPPIERKVAMDPVVEHVVPTDNPTQPQITMFLRPPLGMTDASQAKGVLCISLLAGSLDGVRRQLQGLEAGQDVGGIIKFAEDHRLVIICWGSRGLWDPTKNWDDLAPDDAWSSDKAFDQVANAWANGVQYFIKEYGIPSNGYLMWGMSGSAQYACRLALRKPDYFLAVHVHIPSSFDKPTPEGRKVLWCLTTGELEGGHARSLRFYSQCRELGYPMIYKAIIGLGHAGSPIADSIGAKFFEYALTVRDQRVAYDQSANDPLIQFQQAQTNSGHAQPWIESFRKPAFVGDVVNQEIFPFSQNDMVPATFRTPLPTKEIADAWNQ